jgi:hypothetical protein
VKHLDNELRRKLWALADQWEAEDHVEPGSYFADQLRQVLTYPAATEADEAELVKTYGKTSEQLADEAEAGYEHP